MLKTLIVSETSPHKERPPGSITITRIDVSLSTQWSLNKNQIAFSSLGRIPPTTDSLHIFFHHINLLLFIFQALAQLQLIDYIGEQTALLIKVSFPL